MGLAYVYARGGGVCCAIIECFEGVNGGVCSVLCAARAGGRARGKRESSADSLDLDWPGMAYVQPHGVLAAARWADCRRSNQPPATADVILLGFRRHRLAQRRASGGNL